jgi:hypothetical protein
VLRWFEWFVVVAFLFVGIATIHATIFKPTGTSTAEAVAMIGGILAAWKILPHAHVDSLGLAAMSEANSRRTIAE